MRRLDNGRLADVAPTLLDIIGLQQPRGDDRPLADPSAKRGARRSDIARAGAAVAGCCWPRRRRPRHPPPRRDDLDALRRQCIVAARETQQHRAARSRRCGARSTCSAAMPPARRRGLDDSRRRAGAAARRARVPGAQSARPRPCARAAARPVARRDAGQLPRCRRCAPRRSALSGEIARVADAGGSLSPPAKRAGRSREHPGTAPAPTRQARATARQSMLRELLPADPGAAAANRQARARGQERRRPDQARRSRGRAPRQGDRRSGPRRPAEGGRGDGDGRHRRPDPAGRAARLRSAAICPAAAGFRALSAGRPAPPDPAGAAKPGLALSAPAGADVVAPFDGRVVYAGGFRDLGLVLIIRHGGGYHSVLAGLGRVDVETGQWVLAGEPVGACPLPTLPGRRRRQGVGGCPALFRVAPRRPPGRSPTVAGE